MLEKAILYDTNKISNYDNIAFAYQQKGDQAKSNFYKKKKVEIEKNK